MRFMPDRAARTGRVAKKPRLRAGAGSAPVQNSRCNRSNARLNRPPEPDQRNEARMRTIVKIVPAEHWADQKMLVRVGAYLPAGRSPDGLALRSEYGAAPFAQLAIYLL